MKKLALAASAIFCILSSCTSPAARDSAVDQNKQAERDLLKGIETGDTSKFKIATDAVDHNGGPQGRELRGADSIRWYLADMHNHFSDLKFDLINDAVDGDYVYSYARTTGTTKDASMGIPAGTKIDMKGVDVMKFKDGQFTEHWGYMDPNDMMKMMQASGMAAKTDSTKK